MFKRIKDKRKKDKISTEDTEDTEKIKGNIDQGKLGLI